MGVHKIVSYFCSKCRKNQSEVSPGEFAGVCFKCGKAIMRYRIAYKSETERNREYCGVDVLHRDNPRWSDALGVSPSQVDEFKKSFPKLNLEFDREGRCLVRNRKHKLDIMKARGFEERG